MEKDKTNQVESQETSISFLEWVSAMQEKIHSDIKQAKDPELVLGLPIVLAGIEDMSVINMVVADSGAGKSLFSRVLVKYLLENHEDLIVVWADLEYSNVVSKQRNIDQLFEEFKGRFFMVTPEVVATLREAKTNKLYKTTAAIVIRTIEKIQEETGKRIFCIIDSLEDFLEDTSNDTETKRHLFKMLSMRGITFLLNHHINKDSTKSSAMRFRGSMVLKAKTTSMLFITKKVQEDDLTVAMELLVAKIRTAYKPVNKLTIRFDTTTWDIKDVELASDIEEMKILRSLYFVLIKAESKEMQKTALLEAVSKEIRKHRDKVRAVLEKNIQYFETYKGMKRTEMVKLTSDQDKLDELCAKLGVSNQVLSKKQIELYKVLAEMDNEQEINIRLKKADGGITEYKYVKTLKNYVNTMSDQEVDDILLQLQKLHLKAKANNSKSSEEENSMKRELTDEELQEQIIEAGF